MAWHESGNNADTRPDGKGLWFRFELGPKSVITRPSGGQRLPGHGFYEITGLAWTGGGTVRRVDISDRRRPDLQGGGASATGASVRAHAVPLPVEVEW